MSALQKMIEQYRQAYTIRKFAKHITKQIKNEGGFYRQQGQIYSQDMAFYLSMVANLSGAIAEIGVRYGKNFRQLIPMAKEQNKAIYAVDSFEGTRQYSVYDSRPDFNMSIGGVDVFLNKMRENGFSADDYRVLIGWIPEVFQQFPDDIQFSFVVLDVDNYTPTVDSLKFIWDRLQPGGVLFCDDFCTYSEMDAGRAIREFLRDHTGVWIERILPNYQIVLRKAII